MQYKKCTKELAVALKIEAALSKNRLSRFSLDGNHGPEHALELYMWNCELCAAFMMPLHFAEVTTRNAIQKALRVRLSNPWYQNATFIGQLDPKQRDHLSAVLRDETEQHETLMGDDHVVSSLNFGFWDHLTAKRFDRLLWKAGIKHNFPNAYAANLTIRDVSSQIQKVRQWRNRIAHHRVIFDKDPERKFEEILTLIEWVCRDTAHTVRFRSNFFSILNNPPIAVGEILP